MLYPEADLEGARGRYVLNDQYNVRPDDAFRFAVGSFIENV
jgi:hypothetical protein